MVKERIDLDVNVLGGRKIKELEASVAGLAAKAREWRQITNSVIKQALTDNRKLTEQEQQQLKLNRATAEWYNLQQQSQAAILKEKKASNAETVKQLRAQEKVDKFLEKELNTTTRIAEAAKAKTNAALTRAGEDLTKRGFATDAAAGRLEEQRIARESQLEIAASKKLYAYKKKREDQLWKDKLDKREAAKKAEAKNIDMYANKAASATNRSIRAESRAVATVSQQKVKSEAKLESIKIKNIEKNSRLQIAADKKAHAAKVKREDRWFKSQLSKRADQRGARQRGQQGALIGAGFPLLFGGGAGSVVGGGLGGLLGESILGKGGGFAGSIALSAVGAQLDQIATDAKELATATGSLQGAYEYLGEKSLWLSEETKLQADAYIKAGDAAGLQKIANQQLALVQGVDGVDAAKKLYGANQELDLAMAILKQSFLNFATFLLNKIVPIINAIAGTAASNVVLGNARDMAKDDPALLKKIDEIEAANTTKTPMLEGALKSALLNVLAGPLAPAANEVLNPKGVKDLTEISKALSKLDLNAPDTIQATLADREWLDRSGKGSKGGADSNRDAENLIRAQQILAIEQKRLTLMQTMEPMIGRAAQARDRAYALAKADFDTQVAKSKIEAQDIPPLEKKIKLKTEDVKLAQKLLVLKRKNDERLMKEAETLEQIKAYGELDYAIATAKTKELEKQLKLKKKLLQIENSNKPDAQKKAEADAAKKMDGITDLDKYIAKLNKELTDTDAMIIQLSETIITEFSGAMTSAITGLITGTKTAQEAFSEMFANIGKAFIDMATKMIAKALILKALGALSGAFGGGDSGGITADEGLSSGFSMGSGLAKKMAVGGYVTGPTNALIGEGGDSEYVIPSQKMNEAMERYSGGMRGDAVIPTSGDGGGGMGSSGADLSTAINISGGVLNFNDESYIKQDQIPGIINQASKSGEARTLSRLRSSSATRRRVGMA